MKKKVIIIGGGIAGASAAYFMAKKGIDVTLIDRADAGQATDAAAGIINPWLSRRRNKAWYTLVKTAAKNYPQFIRDLETDVDTETGYKKIGALRLHTDQAILKETEERLIERRKDAPEIGRVAILDHAAAREKFPLLSEGYEAVYISGVARIDGRKLRNALTQGARKHGAKIIYGTAALYLEGCRAAGVYVNGERLLADQVIATAGAWMSELLEPFGIRELKVRPQKAQILHVRFNELDTGRLPVVMPPNDQYMVSFDDNRIVLGATHEEDMGYDADVTAFGVHDILSKALKVAPALERSKILEARVGLRPMTDDSLPVIGPLKALDGLLYANGLGATGLTAGPFIGLQLAKLISEEPTDINLEDYQL
jgi:D-amino-acid dehydrogenase